MCVCESLVCVCVFERVLCVQYVCVLYVSYLSGDSVMCRAVVLKVVEQRVAQSLRGREGRFSGRGLTKMGGASSLCACQQAVLRN